MRHLRLRFRTSIIFILSLFSFFYFFTFNTLIWSTTELEPLPDLSKPLDKSSLWSAFHQSNIYDIHATDRTKLKNQYERFSSSNVDDLFRLVQSAQQNPKTFPQNSSWKFEKFLAQKSTLSSIDNNSPINNGDSRDKKQSATNGTVLLNSEINPQLMTKYDQRQLRIFVYQKILRWRKEHQNDEIKNLADLMSDSLPQGDSLQVNTTWLQYISTVNSRHVYRWNSRELKDLFQVLQHGEIQRASEMSQGTQIKVILDFNDRLQGLLKPYRVPRNYQTQPDHFYFSDVERHHAEIAAFHLDRLLSFNRVPPVIGRIINITADIRLKATEELGKTFFTSPANNTCFRGHCSYYCDTSHAVCGKPGDRLEASIQILLPRPPEVSWQKIVHPYRRSYSSTRKAIWESNENYCYERVMIDEDYHSRLLLDMMDLAAFDFLIGNLDRHHMMRISSFGSDTALVHLDNGRAFGRYDSDDMSILAPIRQCCFFRSSTFARLYRLYQQGLSKRLAESLEQGEYFSKILIDEHLVAVDRRLKILFEQLELCFRRYSVHQVIIDDGI